MMTFGFTPRKADYIKSYWAMQMSSWVGWALVMIPILWIGFITILYVRGLLLSGAQYSSALTLPTVFAAVFVLVVIYSMFVHPVVISLRMDREERMRSPVQFQVTEETVTIQNSFVESKVDWGTFRKVIDTKNYYLLVHTVNKNAFQILPKRAFTNAEEENTFRNLLQAKITHWQRVGLSIKDPFILVTLCAVVSLGGCMLLALITVIFRIK
jgi:hypothetical protein